MRGVTAYMGSRLFPDIFQPALPVRGVTRYSTFWVIAVGFQPALPMRGVTNGITVGTPVQLFISTRTPHAGSDPGDVVMDPHRPHFNPHSPCGE